MEKAHAYQYINSATAEAKNRFTVSCQIDEDVYNIKTTQAELYKKNKSIIPVSIQNDATAKNESIDKTASRVITEQKIWNYVMSMIDFPRTRGISAVRNATTSQDIATACSIAEEALNNINYATVTEDTFSKFPALGAQSTIYAALDTEKIYVWENASYKEIVNIVDDVVSPNFTGSVNVGGSIAVGGAGSFGGGVSTTSVTGLSMSGLVPTSAVPLGHVSDNYQPKIQVGSGAVIQTLFLAVPAVSGTTTVTINNSVPTATVGTQIWANTITPTLATSEVKIQGSFSYGTNTSARHLVIYLFRGTTCIGVTTVNAPTTYSTTNYPAVIDFIDSPNTTLPTTYSIRVGVSSAATWYVNRTVTASFGGMLASAGISLIELA